jgi:tetratricopeptide (TPR) repeat protein
MSEHELWNELGNLYYMSGAYPQAVYAYNRSIQMDREFGQPYSNMALTCVQQGKYDAAVELYLTGIPLLTDDKERASSWSSLAPFTGS